MGLAQPSTGAAGSITRFSRLAANVRAPRDVAMDVTGGTVEIVVQKYGGSSVADLERIGRVADRIAATCAEGRGVVVVVSAMGTTTDQLIGLARQVTTRPDRRELDMLLSVGERVTMALVAMALRARGIPAISLTGSQSGIITDESHADARVVEVRPQRIRRALSEGQVVIVAGFQGVSRAREVTTLGRGGSDTTAVVLAAALGARWCEICSDVDGVWSADPRLVDDARRIDVMSLEEGLALARGGAKVLFEDAVRYARDRGVELKAASTFGPGAGTRLQVQPVARTGAIAVAGDAMLVALPASRLTEVVGAGGRVRRREGDRLVVDTRNVHGGLDALGGDPLSVVTAVGSGLGEDAITVDRAHRALHSAGIRVDASGASGDAAWWEVDRDRLDDAVRKVHDALT